MIAHTEELFTKAMGWDQLGKSQRIPSGCSEQGGEDAMASSLAVNP